MVARGGGEEDRERAESPSGGRSSGAIAELADAVGLELPESVAGDDEEQEMEDEFLLVHGIPEAIWESLRGLRESKYASTNDWLGGRHEQGKLGTKKVVRTTRRRRRKKGQKAYEKWEHMTAERRGLCSAISCTTGGI